MKSAKPKTIGMGVTWMYVLQNKIEKAAELMIGTAGSPMHFFFEGMQHFLCLLYNTWNDIIGGTNNAPHYVLIYW